MQCLDILLTQENVQYGVGFFSTMSLCKGTVPHLAEPYHCRTKPGRFNTSDHTLFHELGSERVIKGMSATEQCGASKWVIGAN